MRDLIILFVHIIATLVRLLGPGGIRSVVAESVLVKQQLLILNRSRQRSPNLRSSDPACVLSHSPCPPDPFSHHTETFDSLEPPPNSEEPKVSPALLIKKKVQARSKRTVPRTHRSRCPNKTAQSHLGLSANCSADCPGFEHPNRQRHSSKDSR